MERTLIKDLHTKTGEVALIKGWVSVRRDQGKMVFFDFRDMSGTIQGVVLPTSNAIETAKEVRNEYVVAVQGKINQRPEKNRNEKVKNGDIEMEILEIDILSKAEPLPFDMSLEGYNLDLTTELDHRALTLRHPRVQAIFRVQAVIIDAFREFMKSQDFFEFQAPAIVPATAEGGAEVFQVEYFDKKAYLSQSPQLYKQIVMTAFERVFSVNKIFRAEPSATTRHLTEVVSLDAEMAFINSWRDVRDMSEATVRNILKEVERRCKDELELLSATLPVMLALSFFKNKISLGMRSKMQRVTPYLVSIMAVLMILRGLNLGIPYVSPEYHSEKEELSCCEPETKGKACCAKGEKEVMSCCKKEK
jgi:nondiscriminating aspartyl-tRNA synthetase